MNDFLDDYYKVEKDFNEKSRLFVNSSQNEGLTWNMLDKYEMAINVYYYNIHCILSKHKPDLYLLLKSSDAQIRLAALKLISNGLFDLSNNDLLVEKIIYTSIIGNDEERNLSRSILINREWQVDYLHIIKKVIGWLYLEDLDYYLYKDMGEFLCDIGNTKLLKRHIEFGECIQSDEFIELVDDFSKIIADKDFGKHI